VRHSGPQIRKPYSPAAPADEAGRIPVRADLRADGVAEERGRPSPGPFGLSEEYAERTEDFSRTGLHACVVFGD
jgi:hypothetical protein